MLPSYHLATCLMLNQIYHLATWLILNQIIYVTINQNKTTSKKTKMLSRIVMYLSWLAQILILFWYSFNSSEVANISAQQFQQGKAI